METICYAIPDNRRKTNACKKLAAGTHPTDTSATLQTSGLNQELTGEEMISVHGSPDPHGNRRKLQNELEDPALITTVRRHLSIHDTRLQDKPRKTKLLGLAAAVHTRQHLKADNFRISLWALPGRLSLGSPYMQNLKYSEWNLTAICRVEDAFPEWLRLSHHLRHPKATSHTHCVAHTEAEKNQGCRF